MIEQINIKGYKSIKELSLPLQQINIFIGANGAGKSNFISFFKLVNAIYNQQLQSFVMEEGADSLLYFGRKTTEELSFELIFDAEKIGYQNAYRVQLRSRKQGGLYIYKERSGYKRPDEYNFDYIDKINLQETEIATSTQPRDEYLKRYLSHLQVFHFHDTSATSKLRGSCRLHDNQYLKPDGRNLPAILYKIEQQYPKIFKRIERVIQSVAPYIDKLVLAPKILSREEYIELEWIDKGDLNGTFSTFQLSDGTLRFIALATLLLQPQPPKVIVIDEPELGLHPFAIGKLAAMIQTAAGYETQVLVATQSANLISHFRPENIITVDKDPQEKQSVFHRLEAEQLGKWIEDYSLGNLWERSIITGGQPY